jgi:hypothetical protein
MQIQTLTRLTLLVVFSALTVVSARAQSGGQFVATIPFDFYAAGKTLPAGAYLVARSTQTSAEGLVLRRTDGRGGVFVTTKPSQASEIQQQSKLVFHRFGDEYFLSEVWTSGRSLGRELPISRRERSLERQIARQGASKQKVAILGDKR